MSIDIESKFNTTIEMLRSYESGRNETFLDILYKICCKDSYIASLIEIMFWIPEWNLRKDTKSIEYYMREGIHKIFYEFGITYKNNGTSEILYTSNIIGNTYHDMIKNAKIHTNLIEEVISFIGQYIHNEYTNPNEECCGVIIDVNNDSINITKKIFNNEQEMTDAGYHNDAEYYVNKLMDYGVNCLFWKGNH